jgi:hypothetical protein
MTNITFFRLLLLVFGGTTLIFQGLTFVFPLAAPYQNFFWLTQLFFITLSIAAFFIGKNLAMQKNLNLFSQLIMLFILTKMLFSITIVIGYYQIARPSSTFFLLPFSLLYLTYTVFGTYFLTKIGKQK